MHSPRIFVLHENEQWTEPLASALERAGAPFELWFTDEGTLDLGATPPPGVYYSRMSASAHTRGHRFAPEYTGAVLRWLEAHGRDVLNGSRALALEISKAAQYAALQAHGIRVPHTVAAVGHDHIIAAAESMGGPFVTKHNRGGKGLGVRRFDDVAALRAHLEDGGHEAPVDGVTLVQRYIRSPQPRIVRCEFVDQRFLYAVRVDTSDGFELCPAEACDIEDRFCPAGEGGDGGGSAPSATPRFEILEGFESPLLERYESFLRAHEIAIAGIELIEDGAGRQYTYDINTNTNYNPDAEARAGVSGMAAIAALLVRRLESVQAPARLRAAS